MAYAAAFLLLCHDARSLSDDAWAVRHAAHRRLASAGAAGVWAARLCADRSDPEARMRVHRLCGSHAATDVPPEGLPGIGLLYHGDETLQDAANAPAWLRAYYDRFLHPDHSTWEAARAATCELVRDLRYAGCPRWATGLMTAGMRLRARLPECECP